jgi:hypothetical protein
MTTDAKLDLLKEMNAELQLAIETVLADARFATLASKFKIRVTNEVDLGGVIENPKLSASLSVK